ncbi:MAG TPA: hypothetical protein VNL14_04345 [Candidatus Acidoferrales bacterium]|nr:hypothetical protein [Candidatus Acidoferrales bacterium]
MAFAARSPASDDALMLDNPGIVITIVLIAVAAIVPGWLLRIWIYRIELRRVIEKMAARANEEKK